MGLSLNGLLIKFCYGTSKFLRSFVTIRSWQEVSISEQHHVYYDMAREISIFRMIKVVQLYFGVRTFNTLSSLRKRWRNRPELRPKSYVTIFSRQKRIMLSKNSNSPIIIQPVIEAIDNEMLRFPTFGDPFE